MLPQGEFTTTIYTVRLDAAFSPDLRLNTLAQYNDAAELAGVNVRFNWIYKPGANLFVVYNHNWDTPTFSARETAPPRADRQVQLSLAALKVESTSKHQVSASCHQEVACCRPSE